jgi:hypothetical protein
MEIDDVAAGGAAVAVEDLLCLVDVEAGGLFGVEGAQSLPLATCPFQSGDPARDLRDGDLALQPIHVDVSVFVQKPGRKVLTVHVLAPVRRCRRLRWCGGLSSSPAFPPTSLNPSFGRRRPFDGCVSSGQIRRCGHASMPARRGRLRSCGRAMAGEAPSGRSTSPPPRAGQAAYPGGSIRLSGC